MGLMLNTQICSAMQMPERKNNGPNEETGWFQEKGKRVDVEKRGRSGKELPNYVRLMPHSFILLSKVL